MCPAILPTMSLILARTLALMLLGLATASAADPAGARAPAERWVVPSWGDAVCVYGPGTDASMDSPEAMQRTIERWRARGMTGVTLRTDLADYAPMIRQNPSPQRNPRLQLLLNYVDQVSARFKVLETTAKIGEPLGFKVWAWHPHLYSDGAPTDAGTPGLGRMLPWAYVSRYFLEHPEGVTVDRQGRKLWMVREYAYPEARATKVAEFVHMAKTEGLKRFIACMRSEVNQLVDPPEKGDQYGFNQPVADEMKARYGVDILTDPRFDAFAADFQLDDLMVERWRDLRGEHITQFYRELRAALRAVDPAIQLAVTLSGEHAGPPLGNQRLDWRTWVNEGLIDVIIAPVFFEATLDHAAAQKGYLTRARDGVGTVPLPAMKEFIQRSPHPEIQVITTGAPPYFDRPPPPGADGWRCDAWYELYTSAWQQRWRQWMRDVQEFGAIRFLAQDFDAFDPAQLPPAGALGCVAYDPRERACAGGWYPFGDEASGQAFLQSAVRRGGAGRAVRLTSNGAQGPAFIGYHAADADRSNISAVLDTAITNGTCEYTFWIFRESAASGVITYLENKGGELDVGLKIEPGTGAVSYTTGRSPGGTGTWKATAHRVPIGAWERCAIRVDFHEQAWSAYAGARAETVLAEHVAYTPAVPRTTTQNGVNVEIPVPSYKAFKQVRFEPLGPAGSKVDLDDVAVLWTPALEFTPPGARVLFSDDFEHGADLHERWSIEPSAPGAVQLISSTSYREGVRSVLATRRAELRPLLAHPVTLAAEDALTFDADFLIRSDAPIASLIPGQARTSQNQVALIIERAGAGREPIALAEARDGKWLLQSGAAHQESKVAVPYDCWMQLQVALNLKARTCTVVQQQIGQVAQPLGVLPWPAEFQPGQPLAFRIQLGATGTGVAVDNVRITQGR